jgi:hypothetical protein
MLPSEELLLQCKPTSPCKGSLALLVLLVTKYSIYMSFVRNYESEELS